MDDHRYFCRAIKPLRTPFTVDKEKILKITTQLLEREIVHETLQETFGAYVEACMEYSIRKDAPLPCAAAPYPCDELLMPAKKITSFVTKKNVAHYVKTKEGEEPSPKKINETRCENSCTQAPVNPSQVLSVNEGGSVVLRRSDDSSHGEGVERNSSNRHSGRRPGRVPKTKNDAVPKPRRAVLTETTLEFR